MTNYLNQTLKIICSENEDEVIADYDECLEPDSNQNQRRAIAMKNIGGKKQGRTLKKVNKVYQRK